MFVISFVLSIFLYVVIAVMVLSVLVGAVMFVIDVIRFAPARNKIKIMSSKLQSYIDETSFESVEAVPDEEHVDEENVEVVSDEVSNVSLFKRKDGEINELS